MKVRSAERQQMREYIAGVLSSTGEFSVVEQEYDFQKDPDLGLKKAHNIYCEVDPRFRAKNRPGKYLVIVHSDESMGKDEIDAKIAKASEQGIASVHVLYRFINSQSDPSTQGPLFRRFVLEKERAKGPVKYRNQPVFRKKSLNHYPWNRRNNFRKTKRIERNFLPPKSGHTLLYYQPESARLPECLKRYEWGDVAYRYIDGFGKDVELIAEEVREPILIEEFDFFTLFPMARVHYDPRFCIGDIIGLPDIQTDNADEILLRKRIGYLQHSMNFELKYVDKLSESLSIQLQDFPPDSELVKCLETLLQHQVKKEPSEKDGIITLPDGRIVTLKTIPVPSRSTPGDVYRVTKMTYRATGNVEYTCNCLHFKFKKDCGHIDELV